MADGGEFSQQIKAVDDTDKAIFEKRFGDTGVPDHIISLHGSVGIASTAIYVQIGTEIYSPRNPEKGGNSVVVVKDIDGSEVRPSAFRVLPYKVSFDGEVENLVVARQPYPVSQEEVAHTAAAGLPVRAVVVCTVEVFHGKIVVQLQFLFPVDGLRERILHFCLPVTVDIHRPVCGDAGGAVVEDGLCREVFHQLVVGLKTYQAQMFLFANGIGGIQRMNSGSLELRVPETDNERIAVVTDVKGLQQVNNSVVIPVVEGETVPVEPDAGIDAEIPLHGCRVEHPPVVVQSDPVMVQLKVQGKAACACVSLSEQSPLSQAEVYAVRVGLPGGKVAVGEVHAEAERIGRGRQHSEWPLVRGVFLETVKTV